MRPELLWLGGFADEGSTLFVWLFSGSLAPPDSSEFPAAPFVAASAQNN